MKKTQAKPHEIVLEALTKLKDNEKKVVSERFGLSSKRKTLAAIGNDLKLSRERVRQIEKDGLRKMAAYLALRESEMIDMIIRKLEEAGGIMHKSEAIESIIGHSSDEKQINAIHLIIEIIPEIKSIERDDDLHDSWMLASVPRAEVVEILKDWAAYLAKNKQPAKIDVLVQAHPHHAKHKISFLSSLPKVSKKIIQNYEGDLGLHTWPEFNPKTVRDKIYYILRKNQSPMHFSEIGRAIDNERFDNKKVVVATIHNELIADSRFVLIGRGIYALKEWGYQPGTVKDIIRDVLSKSGGALTLGDIYTEVSKQRQVRKNTILINLQTQKEFKRIASDKFILA